MPQIYDMGPTALFPLRRKACWGFFRPKNPTASAGFEPANLGTNGQHATPRTPKPIKACISFSSIFLVCNVITRELACSNLHIQQCELLYLQPHIASHSLYRTQDEFYFYIWRNKKPSKSRRRFISWYFCSRWRRYHLLAWRDWCPCAIPNWRCHCVSRCAIVHGTATHRKSPAAPVLNITCTGVGWRRRFPGMMSYVTYSRLPVLSQEPPTMSSPYKTNCQHIYIYIFFISFSVVYEGPFL